MCPMDQQDKSNEWHITYHFVWGPMRAKPCLIGEIARRLQALIEEKAREEAFQPVTLLILPDRVYLAAEAPPSIAPHSIVCQVKAYTSRVLRDEFPELTRIPSLWTRAYLVMAGDQVDADDVLRAFDAAQPERRPRGRPRKNPASPRGDATCGPVEL
jgi:REP-associated tyrosine transposase